MILMPIVAAQAWAQSALEEVADAVLQVKTFINPDGRTIANLGREREGSGILIGADGLVLTIGYLIVEAHAVELISNDGRRISANVVGYDHETGFGLVRATVPLKAKPLALGTSAEVKASDPVLVASAGGIAMMMPARVAAKREFAGYWEYLLDEAIFTSPPHPAWSGAALISGDGKLVGVGSLIVPDAGGEKVPGNMFVPIDRLGPILADLIANGRTSGPAKPWLGVTTVEVEGRLVVNSVSAEGPAEKAGLAHGDIILGVGGKPAKSMADFYRQVWTLGEAGVVVPLDVLKGSDRRSIEVKSMNRLDHLKIKSSI
jgi:S1-C subfamily serine protease